MRFMIDTYKKEWRPGRLLQTTDRIAVAVEGITFVPSDKDVIIERDQIALIVKVFNVDKFYPTSRRQREWITRAWVYLLINNKIRILRVEDGDHGIPLRALTK